MAEEKLSNLPSNFVKHVEQIIKEYSDTGKGLVHGFQKDAIQNSVGARAQNSWVGWKCCINLITSSKGRFLTVEDYGTEGLTGPNLKIEEIARMCDEDEQFPEEWRLARLSCNNVSGGLSTGAGLFGIGKTLYSAASASCKYYFESLTKKDGYRCNVNDKNKINADGAYEDEVAKEYILSKTGLEPINHVGTRIIICNPKQEIIDAIENGEMMEDIEETWWRIIQFHQEDDVGIFLNGKKASIPEQYSPSNIKEGQSYEDNSATLVNADYNFRTKKVGFYICNELDPRLGGFFFYRRGMKIGQINLNEIMPKAISDKYYGFIELNPIWEAELVSLENITHYDVMGTKKQNKQYADLRQFVVSVVSDKLKEWGYIKEKESEDRLIHSVLSEIQDNVQSLFKDEGFEDLGKGDIKTQYIVRLKDIIFPNPDERKTVYDGDVISFAYIVKNNYSTKKKFFAEIKIVSPNGFSNIYFSDSYEIEPLNTFRSGKIDIKIDPTTAEKYIDNTIVLSVYPSTGRQNKPKKIVFYYGIETKKNKEKDFELVMSNRQMPKVSDKRVNPDEKVGNIIYSFTNNIEIPTKLRLGVSTHNLEDNAKLIEKIFTKDYLLEPFETKENEPFDIHFSREIYSDVMKKGKIDIRAKLVVCEDNGVYEKGEVVAEYKFTIFYNMNEKRGTEDSFKTRAIHAPDDHRRSWSEGHTGDWTIYINLDHPEYTGYESDIQKIYLEKLVIQEFTILYLKEGKFDQIGFLDNPDGSRLGHVDVLVNLNKKIDEMWWKRCQK